MSGVIRNEVVKAGLQIAKKVDRSHGEYYGIVTGELTVPVQDDKLIYHEDLDIVIFKLKEIAFAKAKGAPFLWRVLIAYDGRCWIIDGDSEVGDTFNLSYFDYPTLEDWIITGAVTAL